MVAGITAGGGQIEIAIAGVLIRLRGDHAYPTTEWIELIRSKQAGLAAPKEKAPARPGHVINLMVRSAKAAKSRTRKHESLPGQSKTAKV
jgi:non-homologous end joining protein Ku